jgi:hypothetical protein
MWYKSLFDIPGMTEMKLNNSAMLRDDDRPSLQMFPLDLDDDASTTLDASAFEPTREESYIGTRPREEETIEQAVFARHAALAEAIASLEQTCASFDSVDPSADAAETSLRRRVGSLAVMCDALDGVASFVSSPNRDLFAAEGLLAPYLAGIYMWAGDVTETLAVLARDLNVLTPNWAALRDRLNEVSWIYDMALAEGRRLESVHDLLPSEMLDATDALLMSFIGLKVKLDEPFG